jgi:hypothetical protein
MVDGNTCSDTINLNVVTTFGFRGTRGDFFELMKDYELTRKKFREVINLNHLSLHKSKQYVGKNKKTFPCTVCITSLDYVLRIQVNFGAVNLVLLSCNSSSITDY